MAYTVYKHTSPSGKVYIGITSIDPAKRWKQGYSHNKHFSMAIKKYGWENIKSEIIASGLTKKRSLRNGNFSNKAIQINRPKLRLQH